MGYAPPRIPLEQRREAIAAAEAKTKRGRSRSASSSSSRRASSLSRRSRSSMDLILPTYSLTDPNPSSSLNSKRDQNARRTIGSGTGAHMSGHGGGATAAGQPSPSSSRSQTKRELTRTGERARSCPPISRVVSPDSRMTSRPRHSTQGKPEGQANGSDKRTSSVANDLASRHGPVTSKTRPFPPVNRNELCAKRSSSELTLGTKPRAKLAESGITRSKSEGITRKMGSTMGSKCLQAHDAKQRFEALRRQPGNRYSAVLVSLVSHIVRSLRT